MAEKLQSGISRYSQLAAPTAPLDLGAVLKYAHKIAYTSYAPLGHDPSQPLPQHFRPPNPQEWQLRASQLHQFQGLTSSLAAAIYQAKSLLHAAAVAPIHVLSSLQKPVLPQKSIPQTTNFHVC